MTAPEIPDASPAMVREELAKVIGSPPFAASPRLRHLLSYIVERTLDGDVGGLKEYTLAVEVFRRPASFDSRLDPIVRVQVSNLRTKLKAYYADGGRADPVLIDLPKGTYICRFIVRPGRQKDAFAPEEISPEAASVAVLACADLSPSHDQEYFCDGITEEIINALASIKEIRVVGRTSVFRFKGKKMDTREIGALLGVRFVLETSFRRDGNQIRITAYLTEITSGFTLWSKTFTAQLDDVFTVQEEIARSIVWALRGRIITGEEGHGKAWRSRDVESYNQYLVARYHLNKRDEKSIRRSVSILERLLARDRSNAAVLSGLAACHLLLGLAGADAPAASMKRAERFAGKALSLDDGLSEAHASLASVKALYDWDWSAADRAFRLALDLDSGSIPARTNYAFAYLLPMGCADEAVRQLREAVRSDPLSLAVNQMLAFALYASRRYEEVIQQCLFTIDLEPSFARAYALLGLAYGLSGLHRQAEQKAESALRLPDSQFFLPNWGAAVCVHALAGQERLALRRMEGLEAKGRQDVTSSYWPSVAHASLGHDEKALKLLKAAVSMRDPWVAAANYDPLAESLRRQRRFRAIMRPLGLPGTGKSKG